MLFVFVACGASARAAAAGDLALAKAHWLAADTLAWQVPGGTAAVRLCFSADASLAIGPGTIEGGESIALASAGIVDGVLGEKFRHLAGLPAFRLPAAERARVPVILKQQYALAAYAADGRLIDATSIQPAGVLDDLFTYRGPLGVTFEAGVPTVRVWAPTARSVKLHLFDGSAAGAAERVLPMIEDPVGGTWTVVGAADWNRKFYLFEVEVFVRHTGRIEHNLVTDPYSLSLSMNSRRSQIVNLDDADLKPPGWDALQKPPLASPVDGAIYELHVRDFSIGDESVPVALRGTFKAFTLPDSNGMRHLRQLAVAGLTHVHLLPVFDLATINEDRAQQRTTPDLSGFAPDSEEQQAAVEAIRSTDGFNWGYDPFHYTTPEGSYATDPDGVARIREFREMVAALGGAGLRVVMDVVYNHTTGSLQADNSNLDRIVPDYYHRLNSTGAIETSTCCANTATEHAMMEKLMLDSLRTWATAYKVDAFRFDLMGHHTKANILAAQAMLHALRTETDGVDGCGIYFYGEGWNFGEVADNARFDQATQTNMGQGTGVGTFNDFLRDALRGGRPFDIPTDHVVHQGFVNGLFTDPNAVNSGSPTERDTLLGLTDRIRVGLTGNLSGFTFVDRRGVRVRGADVCGYASMPQESINYVAAHDNETLFDVNQYKLPRATSASDRVRVQNLANSIVALAQGVPFFHAGQDMLRSKSTDRNSFDSGDWFNLLDFTYRTNGWGRGLPPAFENKANWPVTAPMLGDPRLVVGPAGIERAVHHLREMLAIRRSSALFRLRTAEEVQARVGFHNTGPEQVPGLIAMSLRGDRGIEIVVLFNADIQPHEIAIAEVGDAPFALHPVLAASDDAVVRTARYGAGSRRFSVPARTTAVFVRP